jgi:ABC-type uncharacterized transport system permease subunit
MSLSPGSLPIGAAEPLLLVVLAVVAYLLAALPMRESPRVSSVALFVGWSSHLLLLVFDISGWGQSQPGARLGFAPVLSATVWLLLAVHTIESRFVPLPSVRVGLGLAGALAVFIAAVFPGEVRQFATPLGPVHFVLGVASYGLFGAAVLHAALLNAAERRMKAPRAVAGGAAGQSLQAAQGPFGMPLLQLERLTFRFVEAGFLVLTATLLLGALAPAGWRWDHKTIFSLLAWGVFAALLIGRRWRGWRGRHAMRWLYVGALLLLLAYVGSRFVMEVLLSRPRL